MEGDTLEDLYFLLGWVSKLDITDLKVALDFLLVVNLDTAFSVDGALRLHDPDDLVGGTDHDHST